MRKLAKVSERAKEERERERESSLVRVKFAIQIKSDSRRKVAAGRAPDKEAGRK